MKHDASLRAEELLAWNEATTTRWGHLVQAHPEFLDVPCDIYKPGLVRHLLQHIVAAELRYAERLAGIPGTEYAAISCASIADILSTHARAITMLRDLLAQPDFDWSQDIEFTTLTAGRRRATRRAVFHHALLHSIRHYAQLATLARERGLPAGPMDYLMMASRPVE